MLTFIHFFNGNLKPERILLGGSVVSTSFSAEGACVCHSRGGAHSPEDIHKGSWEHKPHWQAERRQEGMHCWNLCLINKAAHATLMFGFIMDYICTTLKNCGLYKLLSISSMTVIFYWLLNYLKDIKFSDLRYNACGCTSFIFGLLN